MPTYIQILIALGRWFIMRLEYYLFISLHRPILVPHTTSLPVSHYLYSRVVRSGWTSRSRFSNKQKETRIPLRGTRFYSGTLQVCDVRCDRQATKRTCLRQSDRSLDMTKMDANLETPASAVTNQNEAKDESSADEDQVLDWSKVASVPLQLRTSDSD
jgi:hypothetical protein